MNLICLLDFLSLILNSVTYHLSCEIKLNLNPILPLLKDEYFLPHFYCQINLIFNYIFDPIL